MEPIISFEPLEEKHLKWFNKVRNSCRLYLHDSRKFSLKETRAWFKTLPENKKYYVIFGEYWESIPIGYFRTNRFNEEIIEVGCDIQRFYRGQGYAKQAYKIMLDRFFLEEGYKIAMLDVLADNTRAFNLYMGLGFEVITGVNFNEVIRDGRRILSIPMGILKETYLNGRES